MPIYDFIKHEVLTRKDEDVAKRAMYDDITECFWQRPQIARMLPPAYERSYQKARCSRPSPAPRVASVPAASAPRLRPPRLRPRLSGEEGT